MGTLFADDVRGINLISGSNKAKVRALHEVLARAHAKGDLPTKFYAVVDKDTERRNVPPDGVTQFSWDVYHIENYLLEPRFISETVNAFQLAGAMTEAEAYDKLASAARQVVPAVLVHQIKEFSNSTILSGINLNFDVATLTISSQLHQAIERSFERIGEIVRNQLCEGELLNKEAELRKEIEASFGDGTWRAQLPGREILKQFVHAERIPTNYEAFRNQVVSRMASEGFKPEGMRAIISKIRDS